MNKYLESAANKGDPQLRQAVGEIIHRISSTLPDLKESIKMYLAGGMAVNFYTGYRPTVDIDASFSQANPFEKAQFQCHRDWEGSLVEFLSREARKPNVRNWLPLATRLDTKRAAAFSALLLSNLVENKPRFRVSVNTLYEIYRAMNVEGGAKNFEEWLRTGWLNVARVANMIDAELKH